MEINLHELGKVVHTPNNYNENMKEEANKVKKSCDRALDSLQHKFTSKISELDELLTTSSFRVERIDRVYQAMKKDVLRHEALTYEMASKF
jgi:hypothetical protein